MPTRTGPCPGKTGDGHQAAHSLGDLIEAGTISVRSVLAKTRDAGVDEPFVDFVQRLVVDPQTELHVRAVILDHNVGLLDKAAQYFQPFRRLQIECQAAFVAVQVLKIRAVPLAAQTGIALRRLDLDHVGAPVGELPHAGRPGAHPRQIDDFEPSERTWTGHDASMAGDLGLGTWGVRFVGPAGENRINGPKDTRR
jgi:hypothetical protein